MAKREQHRQGIVYGPPIRPSGGRDRGAVMGSLLGVIVVLVTAGVLGFAALMYLQGQSAVPPPATATPLPPASASVAPSAAASPSALPVGSASPSPVAPTPPPSDQPSPGITPAPTPFVPQVLIGPGYVTFGTEADSQLLITDPRATFTRDERMVWSAQLTEQADSSELRIHMLKLDPEAPTGQRLIREEEVRPNVRDAQTFLRRVRVSSLIEGPGLYTIRYLRGDVILSEGSFLVSET